MAATTVKHRSLKLSAVALFLGAAVGSAAAGNAVTVGSIDIRGLRSLGKYEILSGAGVMRSDGGFVVDIERLNEYLKKEPLVARYDIRSDNSTLVITVAEKKPEYVIAAVRGKTTTLLEVDGGFNVLSVHKVHMTGQPLVLIAREDIEGGILSTRIKRFLAFLGTLRGNNHRLYREISTLDLRGFPAVAMTLRGRVTRYYLDMKDLTGVSLGALVGYVDRFGGRPAWVEYHGDFGVMK